MWTVCMTNSSYEMPELILYAWYFKFYVLQICLSALTLNIILGVFLPLTIWLSGLDVFLPGCPFWVAGVPGLPGVWPFPRGCSVCLPGVWPFPGGCPVCLPGVWPFPGGCLVCLPGVWPFPGGCLVCLPGVRPFSRGCPVFLFWATGVCLPLWSGVCPFGRFFDGFDCFGGTTEKFNGTKMTQYSAT